MANGTKRKWAAVTGAAGAIAGSAILVLSVVWAAGANHARVGGNVQSQQECLDDHETRLRAVEGEIRHIATDVSWLRDHFDPESQ